MLHSVNFLGVSIPGERLTVHRPPRCRKWLFAYVTFVLHLFYICDGKEDLSILVHSLVGLNGCEWMERGENIDFRDKKLF